MLTLHSVTRSRATPSDHSIVLGVVRPRSTWLVETTLEMGEESFPGVAWFVTPPTFHRAVNRSGSCSAVTSPRKRRSKYWFHVAKTFVRPSAIGSQETAIRG